MATYKKIQEDVKKHNNCSVKTCWIAHVKELNNLPVRNAPNRVSPNVRQVPCPDDIRPIIEASMQRLGML